MNRANVAILAGILIVALGLRIWGIGFGLPDPYHADEPTYVSAALNLGAGIIGRQPNPTAFSNILFGEYAAYYLIGRLGGLFSSTAAFEQAYRADPSVFLLLSRLTSALLGTATVMVVYWLGARTKRRIIGLLAALLLAVTFLHVRDSHYGVPDVATAFFIGLTVLLCILTWQKGESKYLYGAAAAASFAVATKWSVWPVGIPFLITAAVFFRQQVRQTAARNSRLLSSLLLVGLCLFVGFALGGFQTDSETGYVSRICSARSTGRRSWRIWLLADRHIAGVEFLSKDVAVRAGWSAAHSGHSRLYPSRDGGDQTA